MRFFCAGFNNLNSFIHHLNHCVWLKTNIWSPHASVGRKSGHLWIFSHSLGNKTPPWSTCLSPNLFQTNAHQQAMKQSMRIIHLGACRYGNDAVSSLLLHSHKSFALPERLAAVATIPLLCGIKCCLLWLMPQHCAALHTDCSQIFCNSWQQVEEQTNKKVDYRYIPCSCLFNTRIKLS